MMQAIPNPAADGSAGDSQFASPSGRKGSFGIPSGSTGGSVRRNPGQKDRNGKYHFMHQQPQDKRRPSVRKGLDERSQHNKKHIGDALDRFLGEDDSDFLPPRTSTPRRTAMPASRTSDDRTLDRPSEHSSRTSKSGKRRTSSRNVNGVNTSSISRKDRDPPTPRKNKQPSVRTTNAKTLATGTLAPTSEVSSQIADAQTQRTPVMVPTKDDNQQHNNAPESMSPGPSPSGSVSTKKSRGRSLSKRFQRGGKKESKRDMKQQQQLLSGGTEPNESFLSMADGDSSGKDQRSRSRSRRFQDSIKENFDDIRRRRKQSQERRRSKRFEDGEVRKSTRQAAASDSSRDAGADGASDVESSPRSSSSRGRSLSASGRLGKMLDKIRSRSASKRRNDARSVASTPVDIDRPTEPRKSTRSAITDAVSKRVRAFSSDGRRRRRSEDERAISQPRPQQYMDDDEDPNDYVVPTKRDMNGDTDGEDDNANRRHSLAAQRTRPLPSDEEVEYDTNIPGPRPQSMMLHREVTRRTKANSLSDLQKEYSQEELPSTSYFASNHILVNRERMKRGLKPCTRNKAMDEIARDHAKRMADSAGCQPIQTTFIGNVLRGESIRAIHRSTMQNKQGRERYNILNPYFQEFGIGTAKGEDGMLYMCQLFSESLTLTCKDAVQDTKDSSNKAAKQQQSPSAPS